MTIKLLLTIGLVMCSIYVLLQASVSTLLNNIIYCATVAGIYFVWNPDQTTVIARWVGVGRGADLILYMWILINIVIGFNVHLKLAVEARRTTLLARRLALSHPIEPPLRADIPGSPGA